MTAETLEIRQIRKRDGRYASFDLDKITAAIKKAFIATGEEKDYVTLRNLSEQVCDILIRQGERSPEVEHIQDTVEQVLIENGFARTAKAYILYRAQRSQAREMRTRLMRVYEDLTFKDSQDSNLKRENANIDCDTAMGTMLKYGSEGAKQFYELFVLNPKHTEAHKSGDIHIHDLDFLTLTTTCCQIDLIKLFNGGFSTGHGYLREPNRIGSYAALACIAIQANQNDQHGGQSIGNFDYGLAPGVAKTYVQLYRDNIKRAISLIKDIETVEVKWPEDIQPQLFRDNGYAEKEREALKEFLPEEEITRVQNFARVHAEKETDKATYGAMEALVHNLNTMHSRAGAQTPFSSINYGCDTSPEGRMVIKNVLLATEAGLGNGETSIFPIQIFRVKAGISYNPGDPNYDLFKLACEVSAKRLFPNFSFIDAPFNLQFYKEGRPETEVAYMGCRTRVISNVHDKEQQTVNGRGNLSFTSINLPKLAIKAKGDVRRFYEMLDEMIALVSEQMLERFAIQSRKRVRNFPFLMGEGIWLDSEKLTWEDEVGEVLKHGTLSMGFIGLAETLTALIGKHHGESAEAQKLGLEIVG
ncbi:MAG: anaerobic ribonucleoside triphosphate reductase, partial [Oscillospiraceae bacterium]|nr:anaerobic ribonucleoside triphosphate reductase [Oscillospiraceae bacterium]